MSWTCMTSQFLLMFWVHDLLPGNEMWKLIYCWNSFDGSSVEATEDDSPPRPLRMHLPTKAPTVRYVPNSGFSRYKLGVQSLVPFRRTHGWVQVLLLLHVELKKQ